MKNNVLKSFLLVGIVLSAILLITVAVSIYLVQPVSSFESENGSFKVNSGATLGTVAEDLYEQKFIRSSKAFYAYGRIFGTNLQAGIFSISPSMSVKEILTTFESGRFESIRVSIPEGLTISKIAALLEQFEVTTAGEFISATKDESLLSEYGIPSKSFEGYLFPDTYNLDPDMSGEAVLRILVDNFFLRISEIEGLKNVSPEELFEKLTLASIVEREYRVTDEAPLIASVFLNRINKNIGLYSCATLEYIITEIQGKPHPKVITYEDIQIDNPYNTYMWAGLPPTPISNPGMVALRAASEPANTNYYYFRLIDASIGNHIFTEDFDDHVEAGTSIQTKSQPS